jgi:hypothetical protein
LKNIIKPKLALAGGKRACPQQIPLNGGIQVFLPNARSVPAKSTPILKLLIRLVKY